MQDMTHDLFRNDAHLRECTATVTAVSPQGVVLDRTLCCPMGGTHRANTQEIGTMWRSDWLDAAGRLRAGWSTPATPGAELAPLQSAPTLQ